MGLTQLLAVGLRLATAGGKTTAVRLALMALGPAIGVVALLGALSVYSAAVANEEKAADRYGQVDSSGYRRGSTDVTLRWDILQLFRGRTLNIVVLRKIGAGPTPPGVSSVPEPGTALVSPELLRLLGSEDGDLLRPRLAGRIVGTIAPQGLVAPNELIAYVGAPASIAASPAGYRLDLQDALVTKSFDGEPTSRLGLTLLLVLAALGLLAPIAVLVVTSARLAAATRQARIAAVRLIGASRRELALVLGAESAVVAGLGCLAGVALFALARSSALRFDVVADRWFASELQPSWTLVVAVIVAIPVLAAAVATIGLRKVIDAPSAAARRMTDPSRSRGWLVAFAAGTVVLGLCALFGSIVRALPSPLPGALIVAGVVPMLLGLAVTTTRVSSRLGERVAASSRRASVVIAGRRLQNAPGSATRAVAAIAIFLSIVVVIQGVAALGQVTQPVPRLVKRMEASDILVTARPAAFRSLLAMGGVTTVTPISAGGKRTCRAGYPCTAVVGIDGKGQGIIEAVRNLVGWNGVVQTRPEFETALRGNSSIPARVRQLSLLVLLMLIITGASLLISTVDGIVERRTSLAALSAFGTPPAVLRTSVALELFMPVLCSVTLGAASGSWILMCLAAVAGETLPFPFAELGLNVAFTAGVTTVVAIAALPWIRQIRKPDLLRSA